MNPIIFNKIRSLHVLAGFVATICGSSLGFAQVMLSPTAVVYSSISSYNDSLSVTNMINQSGVETPFVSGVTSFPTYFTEPHLMWANSGNGGGNNWWSTLTFDPGYQGYVDFDLGAVYSINGLAIWNQSLSNVTVKVLTDLGGAEQVVGDFNLINRQNYFSSYPVDMLPFATTYQARYVRLVINSIHPLQGFSFGYTIVGEVVASVTTTGTPAPMVSISSETNGDITLNFIGTLQTATSVTGVFTNVPGNPSSPLTIPKANLLPAQFFRTSN